MELKPGQRRKLEPGSLAALTERGKASIRAKSLPSRKRGWKHPFLKVKRWFGYAKVLYRGLAFLLGLSNLLTAQSRLAR